MLNKVYTMVCSKCNKNLSVDNFYRDYRYKKETRYRKICKQCCRSKYKYSYHHKNLKQFICENCKKLFEVNIQYAPNPRFCSRQCHAAHKSILDYSKSFMTPEIQSYVDGLMLSDLTIRPEGSFQWNLKYEEFANFIANKLSYYDCYVRPYKNVFRGRSHCHPDIKYQRTRWYPNGIKIVPEDVIINQTSIMMLYIGDGSLHKIRGNIHISTLSFSREENEFLVKRMRDELGIESRVISTKHKFQIYISRPNAVNFLRIIGGKSPVRCYNYKFDMPDKQAYRNYQKNARKRRRLTQKHF